MSARGLRIKLLAPDWLMIWVVHVLHLGDLLKLISFLWYSLYLVMHLSIKQAALLTEWDNRHYRLNTLFWAMFYILGFGATFGVFSYFWCKIWCHTLARQPPFPIKVTKFCTSQFSRSDAGQTDDRHGDRNIRSLTIPLFMSFFCWE